MPEQYTIKNRWPKSGSLRIKKIDNKIVHIVDYQKDTILFSKINKFKNRLSKASKFYLYKNQVYEKVGEINYTRKVFFILIEGEKKEYQIKQKFINKKNKEKQENSQGKKEFLEFI